ncbi:MAG: site-specific DNA-methyltransferase [Candidatus Omnitrophica bacterium]|nr:site-specific DNA-methyltransferase [Candidatus Omnitrophota bacterium]
MVQTLITQNWYKKLVNDCKTIITSAVSISRWSLVEGYWKLGERIEQEVRSRPINLIQLFQALGESISKCSKSTFYYSHQFYLKYPDLNKLDELREEEGITWTKIITQYLPALTDEEIKQAETKQLPPTLNFINNDFRKADIEENSIDCIITDPPYPQEFLSLWKDLGEFAYKVLKPSGFLIAYSGQYHLPKVFELLNGQLEYVWTMAILLPGSTQIINARNLMCGWKPILIYCKPPFRKLNTFYDVITSPQGEKQYHNWQQSEGGVRKLIEIFSNEGDIILDPFSGVGTFPKVAYEMKRQAIGIEIDKISHLKAINRI